MLYEVITRIIFRIIIAGDDISKRILQHQESINPEPACICDQRSSRVDIQFQDFSQKTASARTDRAILGVEDRGQQLATSHHDVIAFRSRLDIDLTSYNFV